MIDNTNQMIVGYTLSINYYQPELCGGVLILGGTPVLKRWEKHQSLFWGCSSHVWGHRTYPV